MLEFLTDRFPVTQRDKIVPQAQLASYVLAGEATSVRVVPTKSRMIILPRLSPLDQGICTEVPSDFVLVRVRPRNRGAWRRFQKQLSAKGL